MGWTSERRAALPVSFVFWLTSSGVEEGKTIYTVGSGHAQRFWGTYIACFSQVVF